MLHHFLTKKKQREDGEPLKLSLMMASLILAWRKHGDQGYAYMKPHADAGTGS